MPTTSTLADTSLRLPPPESQTLLKTTPVGRSCLYSCRYRPFWKSCFHLACCGHTNMVRQRGQRGDRHSNCGCLISRSLSLVKHQRKPKLLLAPFAHWFVWQASPCTIFWLPSHPSERYPLHWQGPVAKVGLPEPSAGVQLGSPELRSPSTDVQRTGLNIRTLQRRVA